MQLTSEHRTSPSMRDIFIKGDVLAFRKGMSITNNGYLMV